MVEYEIQGLKVQVWENNIKILDSFKITDKKQMREILKEILVKDLKSTEDRYQSKRSINSLIREWRCHNWMYKHGLFPRHTEDCDFECNEALYRRIIYLLWF